jgi:hypothetical protein
VKPDLRDFMGSLFVLPGVIVLWGSHWDAPLHVDHVWLIPVVWGLWAGLRATTGSAGLAGRAFQVWRRFDPAIAGLLVYAVLFRTPQSWIAPGVLAGLVVGALVLLRRASGPILVALLAAVLVFGVVVPRAFRTLLIAKLAETHDLTVDHRLAPDGGEINSHGARFYGEPAELADEDFVVLFMGDSFTFGFSLPYDDAYPYQLEKLAREIGCDPTVRVVNMGWTSSSPLLALRLLREVGWEYRPDLIVYSLDMTDFHDDLRYERALREEEDFALDTGAVLERLVASELPWAQALMSPVAALARELRQSEQRDRARRFAKLHFPGPNDRYFITEYALARTRAAIELGVMKNLAEWHAFATETLGAKTALVIYPRAYQYSEREALDSWDASHHTRLGPFAREPFRYFEERADALPYPVIDILPDFEQAKAFPLYFRRDPHWTRLGAKVAARAVFRELEDRGLLPCAGP